MSLTKATSIVDAKKAAVAHRKSLKEAAKAARAAARPPPAAGKKRARDGAE